MDREDGTAIWNQIRTLEQTIERLNQRISYLESELRRHQQEDRHGD